MRKIFMVGASAAASVLLMTGCNKQVIDLTYEYSQAQIKMPDGTVIEGKVDSWNDYEGDQLQVKINGTTYLGPFVKRGPLALSKGKVRDREEEVAPEP